MHGMEKLDLNNHQVLPQRCPIERNYVPLGQRSMGSANTRWQLVQRLENHGATAATIECIQQWTWVAAIVVAM